MSFPKELRVISPRSYEAWMREREIGRAKLETDGKRTPEAFVTEEQVLPC
jgi:hypothetical protein